MYVPVGHDHDHVSGLSSRVTSSMSMTMTVAMVRSLFFLLYLDHNMAKRASHNADSPLPSKRLRLDVDHPFTLGRVASPEAAAAADADPPLGRLLRALENAKTMSTKTGDSVAYWMRMEDMRSKHTRFLHLLSSDFHQSVIIVRSHRLLPWQSKVAFHFLPFLS
jgi:hypothetical protein